MVGCSRAVHHSELATDTQTRTRTAVSSAARLVHISGRHYHMCWWLSLDVVNERVKHVVSKHTPRTERIIIQQCWRIVYLVPRENQGCTRTSRCGQDSRAMFTRNKSSAAKHYDYDSSNLFRSNRCDCCCLNTWEDSIEALTYRASRGLPETPFPPLSVSTPPSTSTDGEVRCAVLLHCVVFIALLFVPSMFLVPQRTNASQDFEHSRVSNFD